MPRAVPRFATQLIVVVPQPAVMLTLEMSLVFGITANGAVPVSLKATGATAVLTATLWEAPLVMVMVGLAGGVIVTVADPDPIWP